MAKTTGPLMSIEASGAFAKSMVFDKRGWVRGYKIPANPKTGAQGNVRQVILAVQKVLKRAGPGTRQAIKAVAPIGYRWNAFAVQQIIGKNSATYQAAKAIYDAFDITGKTAWVNAADGNAITESLIAYASDGSITSGAAFFVVCYGLWHAGVTLGLAEPTALNYTLWSDEFPV